MEVTGGIARPSNRAARIARNRFGHVRAAWRICFYVALVIGLHKAFSFVAGARLSLQGENFGAFSLLLNRFSSKSIQMLCVLIPALVLLRWLDRRPVALLGLGRYRGAFRELSLGMLLGCAITGLYAFVLWVSGSASFTFNGLTAGMALYLAACLAVFVVSALYEEVLFRGYIFQALIEGTNFYAALIVFALLFGSAHLQNESISPLSIAATVVAGVFTGLLYYRTRALWMPIGAHFVWNWMLGPVFGMGTSPFLKQTLFTYASLRAGPGGPEAIGDGLLALIVVIFTAYLWKARWLHASEYNERLWLPNARR